RRRPRARAARAPGRALGGDDPRRGRDRPRPRPRRDHRARRRARAGHAARGGAAARRRGARLRADGQPARPALHLRNRARGGRAVVRRAQAGEELRTLDGTLRTLDRADLMIADADRSIALAGIMGGEETEVSERTTSVLLEAANFEPVGILRSSERHALRTEG